MSSREYLTVADIAQIRGTDRTAAWKWLRRNARSYLQYRSGPTGRIVAISPEDFKKASDPERLERRVGDIEQEMREITRRVDKHAEALAKVHLL